MKPYKLHIRKQNAHRALRITTFGKRRPVCLTIPTDGVYAPVAIVISLRGRSFLFASLEVTGEDGGEHGQEEGAPRLPLLFD